MDKKKYSHVAFWFLAAINIISLFESIITKEGGALLTEPEFQNLLLLAILQKLTSVKTSSADDII
ncbi:hypothetical protein RJ41_15970 [Alteromonas marina]|jgi:surface polysaccharide O-acyltransferase-like enzyme|uniref:Uncharacterized protein n=1 Tax=Alteromonas marina TaxID=203795 RepID=A0A0B3XXX5_9ALTE|nr:hypothetical protein [Alteromonas marina]KHT44378.1 hypothetical protein RJ41_15970 [Alteromonas marina]MEC9427998.1 hypothetical protein [Pseudomonadota bacterium]|tara:strand:- start:2644 stop:2838 length:195 start_codon:yes stop_codon:yes gene_type:complete